jgi:hypothetical protein
MSLYGSPSERVCNNPTETTKVYLLVWGTIQHKCTVKISCFKNEGASWGPE